MTIREIIAEHRRRVRSSNAVERLAAAILMPNLLRERLRQLKDSQVGQLLDDEVGAHLNLLGPEATICDVAVDRLKARAKPIAREEVNR